MYNCFYDLKSIHNNKFPPYSWIMHYELICIPTFYSKVCGLFSFRSYKLPLFRKRNVLKSVSGYCKVAPKTTQKAKMPRGLSKTSLILKFIFIGYPIVGWVKKRQIEKNYHHQHFLRSDFIFYFLNYFFFVKTKN